MSGCWTTAQVGDGRTALMAAGDGNEVLEFIVDGTDVVLWFWSHDWSGRVIVEIDGDPREVELYDRWGGFVRARAVCPEGGAHQVRIRAAGTCHPRSLGCQVFFSGAAGVHRP